MPATGTFVLHSMANPPLKAGDYTLTSRVEVKNAGNAVLGPVQPDETHLRITSPRYRLPPDQMLSTFPPANSEGAYESRLPQIALKRRTLPWERFAAPGDAQTPWLALVVIAEGEATLSGEVPVAECVTPGVQLSGPNDVATGTYLSVSRTVIDKVFPKREELSLLCHVREVDINDTELANGDDDGFLAIVIANRLPQFDRTNEKPVRYLACLINCENQLGSLAKTPPQPVFEFDAAQVVFDVRPLLAAAEADRFVMGATPFGGAAAPSGGVRAPVGGVRTLARGARELRGAGSAAGEWRTTTSKIEQVALTAAQDEAGRLVRDVMLEGYRGNLEHVVVSEPTYRFPVLAHWSFTVNGSGGFESLMAALDVGLLGTAKKEVEPPPGAPPTPPAPRPAPEFAETGHVGLPHLTRRGDRVRAWYRGPLGAYPTTRDMPEASGALLLAHVSDQLRRVVPDGREDLSLAAAFEIGRLLALSQPSVVRALLAWRAEQYGAERVRQLLSVLDSAPRIAALINGQAQALGAAFGPLLGRHLVLAAAADPGKVLAPTRPLVDPGRPLPFAREGGLDKLIAEGFGLSASEVNATRGQRAAVRALERQPVPLAQREGEAPLEGAEIERLRAALSGAVDQLTADAIGSQLGEPRALSRSARRTADALDELIQRAERERNRNKR